MSLSVGETATLFRNDAFKVVAMCVDAGGGTVTAEYGVRALVDNTLVFSTNDENRRTPAWTRLTASTTGPPISRRA